MKTSQTSGRLFVVGTPIGNLSDITLRAVETLRLVEVVAAEDTRRTRALLSHLGIAGKALVSLDAHASARAVQRLVQELASGRSVAFVTDAGMPSVSDPGSALVRAAADAGLEVTVIPGPSAVTTAVALSGFVEGSFFFAGFLPRQGQKRQAAIERVRRTPDAVVLFESPHRVGQTLEDLAAAMPEREVCVCRELTKLHEECVRGTLSEVAERGVADRGEFALVLGPVELDALELGLVAARSDAELDAFIEGQLAQGVRTKALLEQLGEQHGLTRRDLYRRVQQLRARLGAPDPDGSEPD